MRHLAGALLLLPLAACTVAPEPTQAEPAPKSVKAISIEAPPDEKPTARAIPEPKPQTAAVPAEIDDDPMRLFGLDGHRVASLLGPASFVRRDGPAEVWQYRAAACVLDVYLYKAASGLTVAHVDLRQRREAALPSRDCYRAMLTNPG